MKACIVTLGIGHWYPRGVDRLIASANKHAPGIPVVSWKDDYPPGSRPFAQECKYAAKPFAVRAAVDAGYDVVLWLDAACWLIKPIGPLLDYIASAGQYVMDNGWKCGSWCKDAALEPLGISRETAMAIPEISTMALGLNMQELECQSFLRQWCIMAADGRIFPGAHTNTGGGAKAMGVDYRASGNISSDPRVLGHRHDQTAASVLAWRREWPMTPRPIYVDYDSLEPDPRTLVVSRGL